MNNKLFVGSLSWDTTDESLQNFFSDYGTVTSATVIKFRDTGRSKGFGFVEFENADDAKKAMEEANGKELDGRTIVVNEARPQEPRENNFRNDDRRGGGRRDDRRGGGGRRDY